MAAGGRRAHSIDRSRSAVTDGDRNDRPAARIDEIGPERDGQRLDNYLVSRLKGVPKSRIYRMLRKGEVRVNRGRAKPAQRLAAGDRVRIPPVRMAERESVQPSPRALKTLAGAICFEDHRALVIDKPAGWAVHGGSGIHYGVIEALRELRPDCPHLELAHRIDRDTSGCLLIAKNRRVLRVLQRALASPAAVKRYLALVHGEWGEARAVRAALRKNVLRGGERMVEVDPRGKPAESYFEPLERLPGATLVAVTLATGRTHQIRVHAACAGHPLAGDDKYGDAAYNARMAALGLKRPFLHAQRLQLPIAERDGGELSVEAPLEPRLAAVLERVRESES